MAKKINYGRVLLTFGTMALFAGCGDNQKNHPMNMRTGVKTTYVSDPNIVKAKVIQATGVRTVLEYPDGDSIVRMDVLNRNATDGLGVLNGASAGDILFVKITDAGVVFIKSGTEHKIMEKFLNSSPAPGENVILFVRDNAARGTEFRLCDAGGNVRTMTVKSNKETRALKRGDRVKVSGRHIEKIQPDSREDTIRMLAKKLKEQSNPKKSESGTETQESGVVREYTGIVVGVYDSGFSVLADGEYKFISCNGAKGRVKVGGRVDVKELGNGSLTIKQPDLSDLVRRGGRTR